MTIFEKIINGTIPSTKIYEDDRVLAILDINQKRKYHTLVIPKIKSVNLMDIKADDLKYLINVTNKIAQLLAKKVGGSGYSLVINNGADSYQEVMHTHWHIFPSYNENKRVSNEKLFIKKELLDLHE